MQCSHSLHLCWSAVEKGKKCNSPVDSLIVAWTLRTQHHGITLFLLLLVLDWTDLLCNHYQSLQLDVKSFWQTQEMTNWSRRWSRLKESGYTPKTEITTRCHTISPGTRCVGVYACGVDKAPFVVPLFTFFSWCGILLGIYIELHALFCAPIIISLASYCFQVDRDKRFKCVCVCDLTARVMHIHLRVVLSGQCNTLPWFEVDMVQG